MHGKHSEACLLVELLLVRRTLLPVPDDIEDSELHSALMRSKTPPSGVTAKIEDSDEGEPLFDAEARALMLLLPIGKVQ